MQGFGNQQVFPAGPLREPIEIGIKKADIIIFVGDEIKKLPIKENQLHFRAKIKCVGKVYPKPVVAFAGLGYPDKFKRTLETSGYMVEEFIPFADHHPYTIPEIQKLLKIAAQHKARLITTSKDHLRIPYKYRGEIDVLPVVLRFSNPLQIQHILGEFVEKKLFHLK
jgi:tetraacyldisaccharide 4'-kinase